MGNETTRYLVIEHNGDHENEWFDTVDDAFKWIKELLVKYEADAEHIYAFRYTFNKYGFPIKKELVF